jgi:hypothetical protein
MQPGCDPKHIFQTPKSIKFVSSQLGSAPRAASVFYFSGPWLLSSLVGFPKNEEIAVNMVIAGINGVSVVYDQPDSVSTTFYFSFIMFLPCTVLHTFL